MTTRPEPYKIHNRSYLGCKHKMLPALEKIIEPLLGEGGTLWDVFGGTGVVGYHFATPNRKIIYSDLLDCNLIMAWPFLDGAMPLKDYWWVMDRLNNLTRRDHHRDWTYAQDTWGSKYFAMADAERIDLLRETIKLSDDLTEDARIVALSALLYAADRAAQTFGHFDAFKKPEKWTKKPPLMLGFPNMVKRMSPANDLALGDANVLVRETERFRCTVAFLDPPYNTRDYGPNYHVLQSIAVWDKPPVRGLTAKCDVPRSAYAMKKEAEEAFSDLVAHLPARYIVVTYNNQPGNILTAEFIKSTLSTRGRVEVHEIPHKIITAGLSDPTGNAEMVYVCRVVNP